MIALILFYESLRPTPPAESFADQPFTEWDLVPDEDEGQNNP